MLQSLKMPISMSDWSVLDSEKLYRVSSWGNPYFFVNSTGHMAVHIQSKSSVSIDIASVIEEIQNQGIELPILLRFQDLLGAQVERLNDAFQSAIELAGYGGLYQSVYPIKVNQAQSVVEEILKAGHKYRIGLECGSKAEFLAALPYLDDDQMPLICNGIKDRTMFGLIVSAQRLGKKVIPVLERLSEFVEFKSIIWETGYSPILGARIRLGSEGSGRWSNCSGQGSKFGLSISELIRLTDEISSLKLEDNFQLLHCHLGSQIEDIWRLKQAIRELTQIYASLVKRGIGIRYLDIGGGLGVNYDEGGTGSEAIPNYDLQEYASVIVTAIKDVCDEQGVQTPVLITESGRAITAYHSVLIVPVLESQDKDEWVIGDVLPDDACAVSKALFGLMECSAERMTPEEALAILHHAKELHNQTRVLFTLGSMSIEEHAITDRIFWVVCRAVYGVLCSKELDAQSSEFLELENLLALQLTCNFSIFRSILDHWGVGQRFPVMPIDRLDEKPLNRAALVDLTCDSDGKVSSYVSSSLNRSILPVHSFLPGGKNHLGFFLLGAYQDSMGDAHNLFGKVGEAHVRLDLDKVGNFSIERIIPETTVQEMLMEVHYVSDELQRRMRELIQKKYQSKEVSRALGRQILEEYMTCLQKSTYCDSEVLSQSVPR